MFLALHILEYAVELCFLFVGKCCGYGRVKTLTDQSVRNCQGDIKAFRPTIMVGVPVSRELIRKGILAQVNAGPIRKSRFNGAMTAKEANMRVLKNVVNLVVFAKIRQAMGGRMRLALLGGVALSRETQEFLNLALVTILQGVSSSLSLQVYRLLGLNSRMQRRLLYDRDERRVRHPSTRYHAVWYCGSPCSTCRNQVP